MQKHDFGGSWTEEKLLRVEKYLRAYMQIMKKYPFATAYVDAFAGTGYRTSAPLDDAPLLAAAGTEDVQDVETFKEGSVIRALRVTPPFDKYILIEREAKRIGALHDLVVKQSAESDEDLMARVEILNEDCNNVLQELAGKNWSRNRAVVFLDPYGMQVEWRTLEALAATEAVDLWILFPHANGVNRMLKRDGNISTSWKTRLDKFFGTPEWYDVFYRQVREPSLLGEDHEYIEKTANLELIKEYFLGRLRSIFPGVSDETHTVYNNNGTPLYLLCFAAANPKGAPTAVKIAQHILRK